MLERILQYASVSVVFTVIVIVLGIIFSKFFKKLILSLSENNKLEQNISKLENKKTMVKHKRIYISGKITGLSYELAFKNFQDTENMLRVIGYEDIINPMKLFPDDDGSLSWEEYMLKDIEELFNCTTIYMMDNWSDSRGARVEHKIAFEMGKEIIYYNSTI